MAHATGSSTVNSQLKEKPMRNKLATFALALSLGGVGTAGVSHASTDANGANFTAYNAGEVNDLDYLVSGVRVVSSTPRAVIASVDHHTSSPASALGLDVYGRHIGAQTTQCTATVTGMAGQVLYSVTKSSSANNSSWTLEYQLVPGGTTLSGVLVSVLCTLPGNSQAVLTGYEAKNT